MAVIFSFLLVEFFGAVLIIIAGVYIYFRYFLYNYWRKKGVTYLEPTIPTGNLTKVLAGKMSISELYAEAYIEKKMETKKNRYFGMYTFHKPSLVIIDPDLIKFILIKEFSHFHDRGMFCNEESDPLSGHLFGLSGTKWRTLRTKLTPTFTSGKLKQMFGTIVELGENLTRHLKPIADKREVVDLKDIFSRYGIDVIMSVAFGINCNSIDNPNSEFRHWGRKVFPPRPFLNTVSMFAPGLMNSLSIPLTDKGVTKFFTNVFKETVEYREANNVTKPDFMNLLIQLIKRGYLDGEDNNDKFHGIADDAPNGKLTMVEATAQAYIFFVAGFESTSSAMTCCLYEMARNQDIQDKLMKEIDATLEKFSGRLTYEALDQMTYFTKVFSETLRKYPSVPVINRVCTQDIDLPITNFHVDKGVNIVIPVLGLHRDPEIYPNPDKFDPERFNAANIAARHSCGYLPFGEGPRICIGKRFSYAQSKIGIISVLSKYRVKMTRNTRVPIKFDPGNLILTSEGPIKLRFEPR